MSAPPRGPGWTAPPDSLLANPPEVTRTARWSFSIGIDKLRIDLAGEAGDASPVSGPGGLLNDGSDFERRFDVLPGDVVPNAVVDNTDVFAVFILTRLGAYFQRGDINGNHQVDSIDSLIARVLARLAPSLPPGEPADPS